MADERNTITVAKVSDEQPDQSRISELSRQVLEQFTKQGDMYRYKDVPDVVAFKDNGDSIGTDLDNPEVATAMTKLAESKGWSHWMTDGSPSFYSAVEKRAKEATEENERLKQSAPVKDEPHAVTKADEPTPNAVTASKVDDIADDRVLMHRQALAQAVYEQYRVAGSKYYFKDQAGNVNQLAFKETDNKLSTALNTERVTRSLIDLAEAKGWSDIKVSGHKEFKRQIWRAATERGIEVSGYKPDDKDLAVVSDKALKNSIEPEPVKQASKAPKLTTKNRDVSGVLVDHGPAPYQDKPENKQSYFVTIDTGKGRRTVWGVDLADALTESNVQPGERVLLRQTGTKPVTVEDNDGKLVNAMRKSWSVERGDKREVIAAVGEALTAQQVHNPDDRRRIAKGIQARMDAQNGPLPQVQVYDNNASNTASVEPAKARPKAPELIR